MVLMSTTVIVEVINVASLTELELLLSSTVNCTEIVITWIRICAKARRS